MKRSHLNMKAENTLKSSTKKKTAYLSRLCMTVFTILLILLFFFIMSLVSKIQGTARVVNYAGLIRGMTQRIIKLEITGSPQDGMIADIDAFINGLEKGSSELNLVRLDDADFQAKMQELDAYFSQLKMEIAKVRTQDYRQTDIINKSERFFNICDEATGLAEVYSQKKATQLDQLEKIVFADIAGLLILIAAEIIKTLRYAALNRLLQSKVYLDEATNLPNKNKCEELLNAPDPIPDDSFAAVCVFDLNNLRIINNTMGHEMGDAYIRSFADQLRLAVPEGQFAGRDGGDEFIAIFKDTESSAVHNSLHKLKKLCSDYSEAHPDMPISYAAGYATSEDFEKSTLRELFRYADKNMYIDKNRAKLEEAAKEKELHLKLLSSVREQGFHFLHCIYCDALTDQYKVLRAGSDFFLADDGSYSGAVEQILTRLSLADNGKSLRKQLQLETLNTTLTLTSSPIRLFCQYSDGDIFHRGRLTLLFLDANDSGQLHHFILGFETFQNIENSKTDEKSQLSQYYEQMKQSILENGNYVDALLESAQAVYSVDLTNDCLEKIFYHTTKKKADLDISLPCSYDEYCEKQSQFVTEDTQENYRIVDSSSKLLERFHSGAKQVTVEYQEQNQQGQIYWLQKTVLMSQDTVFNNETGTESTVIHGMILFKNTSIFHEKELQENKRLQVAFEAADSASKAKTEFLNRMSHDIRTPINGIMGMLEIIRKNREDHERVDDCLEKIQVSSRHLSALVNDVLDMSKLEAGQASFEAVDFDISQLMRDVSYLVKAQILDMELTHRAHRENIQHTLLLGYPLQLRQILLNLFSNAIKYNKKGGFIDTTAKEISFDGETVIYEFSITDTGIGMSESFVKKQLFEPFTQEKSDARTQYKGTGLGMSIVKKLIQQMSGTIQVESKLEKGTTFTFRLPFKLAKGEKTENVAGSACETGKELDGIHILLVEDNEINMEIAEFYLTDRGAAVSKAWNGKEALEKFEHSKEGTYDMILMDVMMPVMDGLEAAERIRALKRPDGAAIPILAMTAQDAASVASQCRQAKINGYILKPTDPDQLTKEILKQLKRS